MSYFLWQWCLGCIQGWLIILLFPQVLNPDLLNSTDRSVGAFKRQHPQWISLYKSLIKVLGCILYHYILTPPHSFGWHHTSRVPMVCSVFVWMSHSRQFNSIQLKVATDDDILLDCGNIGWHKRQTLWPSIYDWSCPWYLLMAEILHQLIDSLSHYWQGFIHPRWLFGISEPLTAHMAQPFLLWLKHWNQTTYVFFLPDSCTTYETWNTGIPYSIVR